MRVQGLVTSLDALDVGDEEVITDDLSVAHRLRYAQSVKRGLLSRRKRPTMEQKRPTITSVNLVHDSHSHTHTRTHTHTHKHNLQLPRSTWYMTHTHSHTHVHTHTHTNTTYNYLGQLGI